MHHRHLVKGYLLFFFLFISTTALLPGCNDTKMADEEISKVKTVKIVHDGFTHPCSIGLGRNGYLFVIEKKQGRTNRGQLLMIAPDGVKTVLADNLNNPGDLAIDARGRVFFTETGAGKVSCFNENGEITVISDRLESPSSITVDRDGGIFVSCENDGKILKLSGI